MFSLLIRIPKNKEDSYGNRCGPEQNFPAMHVPPVDRSHGVTPYTQCNIFFTHNTLKTAYGLARSNFYKETKMPENRKASGAQPLNLSPKQKQHINNRLREGLESLEKRGLISCDVLDPQCSDSADQNPHESQEIPKTAAEAQTHPATLQTSPLPDLVLDRPEKGPNYQGTVVPAPQEIKKS